jgi:hypothetical protein
MCIYNYEGNKFWEMQQKSSLYSASKEPFDEELGKLENPKTS